MRGSRGAVAITSLAAVAFLAFPSEAQASKDDGALVYGDFDDDGTLETVASEPSHDNVRGRVYIRDSAGSVFELHRGLSEVLGSSAAWQRFGSSLAVGDFDGDGYDDLAVGAPSASDAALRAGSVHVFYGSSSGLSLSGDQLWHQDSTGIAGVAEQDDYFGEVLTTGDFDCDGYDDLAIGAPQEDLSGKTDAGAVHVLYGSSSGVSSTNNEWYQGYNGVGGSTEAGDRFGDALAAGNFNGDTDSGNDCDDLAIGVPMEDAGALADAGVLHIIDGGTSGLSTSSSLTIDQDVTGVVDDVEAYDYFGKRLVVANVDGDEYADLLVTVFGDACGGNGGSGRHTFFGSSSGLADNELDCDLFGCSYEDDIYACLGSHPPVYATNGADTVRFMFGADIAYGENGDDTMIGSIGPDVLFGNANDDDTSTPEAVFRYYKEINTDPNGDGASYGCFVDPDCDNYRVSLLGTNDLGGEPAWVENMCVEDWEEYQTAPPMPHAVEISSEIDWMRFWWQFVFHDLPMVPTTPKPGLEDLFYLFDVYVANQVPTGIRWTEMHDIVSTDASLDDFVDRFEAFSDENGVYNGAP